MVRSILGDMRGEGDDSLVPSWVMGIGNTLAPTHAHFVQFSTSDGNHG